MSQNIKMHLNTLPNFSKNFVSNWIRIYETFAADNWFPLHECLWDEVYKEEVFALMVTDSKWLLILTNVAASIASWHLSHQFSFRTWSTRSHSWPHALQGTPNEGSSNIRLCDQQSWRETKPLRRFRPIISTRRRWLLPRKTVATTVGIVLLKHLHRSR